MYSRQFQVLLLGKPQPQLLYKPYFRICVVRTKKEFVFGCLGTDEDDEDDDDDDNEYDNDDDSDNDDLHWRPIMIMIQTRR